MSFAWKTAMADREPAELAASSWLLLALTLLTGFGCSAKVPDAVALPPVSESRVEAPPAETKGEDPVATPPPPTVVVIDTGSAGEPQGPKSLAVAAQEERERRAQAAKPVAVIDNQNLAEFSRGQKLTVAENGAGAAPAADTQTTADAVAQATRDENYWRNRGLEIRRRWRESSDRIVELEGKSEELRRRFYAADDPYVRDTQVKPEWDHALDELDQTRREAERAELELERYLTDGRQAGAFPGWLREGAELEPERKTVKSPDAEPTEPVEVQEPADNP